MAEDGLGEELREARETVLFTVRFLRRLLTLMGRSREERIEALHLMRRLKPGELREALRRYLG